MERQEGDAVAFAHLQHGGRGLCHLSSRCPATTWRGWRVQPRGEPRGVAVQLSTLPSLGWIPDDPAGCPAAALERLATAHAIDSNTAVEMLRAYGGWQGETRRKHRAQVLGRLGWRLCAAGERKLLDDFLLARALEHDAPGVLLQLACDWLRAERIVRPSVDSLTRRSPPRGTRRGPRLISGSPHCSSHRDRGSWTACSTPVRTWE